jgi:biotin carboxylase
MKAGPHIVVITRWRERYAEYGRYLDHTTHRVTYVATDIALAAVPAQAAGTVTVSRTDDLAEVRAAVRQLAERHGPPERIVALKEDDLLVAAELRTEWGCPGDRPEELIRFRDKLVMTSLIAAAGLPVPPAVAAPDAAAVERFAGRHGWPVVVKPRIGSSSAGVAVLSGPEELHTVDFGEPLLVQRHNGSPIYHVDGIFDGTDLACWRASRYINTCLGFRGGSFLGSVEEDDPAALALIERHAKDFLAALTDRPLPFHLEVFVDAEAGTCSFLEVGARIGGAEIPFIWREVHGYDLMEAAFHIQAGLPGTGPRPAVGLAPPGHGEVAGWLLAPAPARRPCRITDVTPMTGREPGPYAEVLLAPGEILPAADAYYEHVGGRFRFRAGTSAAVEEALTATAVAFRVSAEPVTAREPEPLPAH